MTTLRVDLNCDLGESLGPDVSSGSVGMLTSITSVNIACGFHAGDPTVMRRTARLAIKFGVAVGAHPSFPDPAGFGRQELHKSPEDVENLVVYQAAALAGAVAAEGGYLTHVKPHGALYNMAACDRKLADAVARGVTLFNPKLLLVGLSGSCLVSAGRDAGLRVAAEVFADRAYEPTGSLRSRSLPDSVIDDSPAIVKRVLQMVHDRTVPAVTGELIEVNAETICVHGDTPGAAQIAVAIREGLEKSGVILAAPREVQ